MRLLLCIHSALCWKKQKFHQTYGHKMCWYLRNKLWIWYHFHDNRTYRNRPRSKRKIKQPRCCTYHAKRTKCITWSTWHYYSLQKIVLESRVQAILMDLRYPKHSQEKKFIITYAMLSDYVNMRRMKEPAKYIQDSACGIGHGYLSFPVRRNVKIISREIFDIMDITFKELYPENTQVIAWPEQQSGSCEICEEKVRCTQSL